MHGCKGGSLTRPRRKGNAEFACVGSRSGPEPIRLERAAHQRSIPDIIALVGRLRQEGVTPFIIEHNMQVLMTLADRIPALHLGRGLMSRPRLPMVDEPFLGLSPAMVKEAIEALARINGTGVSILFIEHNVRIALGMSHRGYILASGRLVLDGKSQDLLESKEVKRIFLGG